MRKLLILLVVSVMALGLLAGCAGDEPSEDPNGETGAEVMYEDGTFVGYSDEGRGFAEVELTIEGDEIVDVNITEYSNVGEAKEYEGYADHSDAFSGELLQDAHEDLANQIIAANSADVDGFTGATSTSNKVIQGAERALAVASGDVEGDYHDGTFFGSYSSYSEERETTTYYVAAVTVEGDVISDVALSEFQKPDGEDLYEKDEEYDYEFWQPARDAMQERFVDANSADVDAFTGATSSSDGWMEAVEDAMNKASIN